jgi:hypothetical protein
MQNSKDIVTPSPAMSAADTPKTLFTTSAGKRSAFYARLAADPKALADVREVYRSRPNFAGAGLALMRAVESADVSLVDLVVFLKNPTETEVAILDPEPVAAVQPEGENE